MVTNGCYSEAFELQPIGTTEPSADVTGNASSVLDLSSNGSRQAATTSCNEEQVEQSAPTTETAATQLPATTHQHVTPSSDSPTAAQNVTIPQIPYQIKWPYLRSLMGRTNTCLLTLLTLVTVWWAYASWREARRANYFSELQYLQAFRDDCRAQNQSRGSVSYECAQELEKALPSPSPSGRSRSKRTMDNLLAPLPDTPLRALYLFFATSFAYLAWKRFSSAFLTQLSRMPSWHSGLSSQEQRRTSQPSPWIPAHIPRANIKKEKVFQVTGSDLMHTSNSHPLGALNLVSQSASYTNLECEAEHEGRGWVCTSVQIVPESSCVKYRPRMVSQFSDTLIVPDKAIPILPPRWASFSQDLRHFLRFRNLKISEANRLITDDRTLPSFYKYILRQAYQHAFLADRLWDATTNSRNVFLLHSTKALPRDRLTNFVPTPIDIFVFKRLGNATTDFQRLILPYRIMALYESAKSLCRFVAEKTSYADEALEMLDTILHRFRLDKYLGISETWDVMMYSQFAAGHEGITYLIFNSEAKCDCLIENCVRCLLTVQGNGFRNHGRQRSHEDWTSAMKNDIEHEIICQLPVDVDDPADLGRSTPLSIKLEVEEGAELATYDTPEPVHREAMKGDKKSRLSKAWTRMRRLRLYRVLPLQRTISDTS